jgi:hypothetical protein
VPNCSFQLAKDRRSPDYGGTLGLDALTEETPHTPCGGKPHTQPRATVCVHVYIILRGTSKETDLATAHWYSTRGVSCQGAKSQRRNRAVVGRWQVSRRFQRVSAFSVCSCSRPELEGFEHEETEVAEGMSLVCSRRVLPWDFGSSPFRAWDLRAGHAPDGIGRSKLAANVERRLGASATSRNWRTVRRLLEITNGYA